jgi:hypothetical protein
MTAERIRDNNNLWRYYVEWEAPQGAMWTLCTDAEFAAHFVADDVWQRLIDACEVFEFSFCGDGNVPVPDAAQNLCAAFRDFQQQNETTP